MEDSRPDGQRYWCRESRGPVEAGSPPCGDPNCAAHPDSVRTRGEEVRYVYDDDRCEAVDGQSAV
jgi:hypothetical protein